MTLEVQEIQWIKNIYDKYVIELKLYLLPHLVDIVEEYKCGFFTFGQLKTDAIICRVFDINYISYQIKYIHGLYFFDFWRIEAYDYGGDMYSVNWELYHYTYIYKNGKLLRDKIRFIIDASPGCIDCFRPSYPVYDLKKLKNEYFTEFICSQQWIQAVNDLSINDTELINKLFKLFYDLTENQDEIFYENHKLFNL
jgi:hypothetical protein